VSKTFEEIGLIVGGLALALASGPIGLAMLCGNVAVMNAMIGIGITTALTGVGIALRPNNNPIGTANTISFGDGTSPRRVIYGQFQTAGVLTDASFPASQNLSTSNQYLQLIYTLTGHEISSFDGVSINGTSYNFATDLVWNATDNLWHLFPGSNSFLNDIYWEHVFFEFDFGRNSSAQPFPAMAAADSSWTSACIQRGCAKVHVVLRADAGWTVIFPSGQLPNIQFLVTGKKLIDPRVITAWQPNTSYPRYAYIVDSASRVWVQVNSPATSGATEPNFTASSYPTTVSDYLAAWTTYGYGQGQISAGVDGAPQGHVVKGRLVNNAWAAGSGPYPANYIIEAPLGYLQMNYSSTGPSGSTEPAFSTTLGGMVLDGATEWVCLGRSWHAINPSNPALVVNDYLQDTDAGMGAALATIDLSSVSAAANVCEEQALIIWNSDNTAVYENQYSANGMFDHSSTRGNVLTSMCGSMAGWVIPPGDLWHVFAGSYQTPTVSLGDGDMRGPIKGDFRLSRRDVCNSVKGKFVPAFIPANPAAVVSMTNLPGIWQSQSFPAYQANGMAGKPNYLNTEDGGQIVWLDLQLDFTTSMWTAQRLAKIAMMRTRFQQTLTLPCKVTALQLEAGDTFAFTHARWGISAKTFENTQISVTMEATGKDVKDGPALGVDITARQTDPSVYEFQGPTSASNYGEYSSYPLTGVMNGTE